MKKNINDLKSILKYIKYYAKYMIRLILETISFIISVLIPSKKFSLPPIYKDDDDKILLLSAIELSKKVKNNELKSVQIVEAYIRRIKLVNPLINAVVEELFQDALEKAKLIDMKLEIARKNPNTDNNILNKPLVGVPFTIKETIPYKNCSFTAGLPRRKNFKAKESNQAIEQLVDDGLIPLAMTNVPTMNLWWDCNNNLFGKTKNPYDLSRIPGGSSGGEAALIGSAGSLIGVGTDMAGSLRIPANFCGIFAHKPTPFTVSLNNLYPAMRFEQEKLRGIGPMTRYACDLLPMLKIMLAKEDRENLLIKLNLDEPVDLKKIKIFYLDNLNDQFVSDCSEDIKNGLKASIEHFNSTYGIPCERVNLIYNDDDDCDENKLNLNEFKYGLALWAAELNNIKEGSFKSSNHENGADDLNLYMEFLRILINSSDYPFSTIITKTIEKFGSKYGTSKHKFLIEKAELLREKFYKLIGNNGVLLMPTHPEPAPHHLTTIFKFLNVSYTAIANTLQAPITQCPLGLSKNGLPFGLQVISKPFNDRITLAVAMEIEKVFGGWQLPKRNS